MRAFRTPLCGLLDIELPIFQAGMGRSKGSPTTPALVAAVSEAGGVGCLGATGLEPEEIRQAIREIRQLTQKPFAVGLLLPTSLGDANTTRAEIRRQIRDEHPAHWDFVQSLYQRFELDAVQLDREFALGPHLIRQQVEVLLNERVPLIAAGLGDPGWVVPLAHAVGARVIGLAGSVRNAERQRAAGVDLVVAQGYEAGGHTGNIANFPLIPQVVDRVAPLPVVAAGGIGDGRAIAAALALGAQGVWCGTAFLFASEADVAPAHREQLSAARSEDLILSRCYTGKPTRIVHTEIVDLWASSGLSPLPMPLQFVLMDDFVASAEASGRYELTNNPAGQIAGMLSHHEPAREILARMVAQATDTIALLQSYASEAN